MRPRTWARDREHRRSHRGCRLIAVRLSAGRRRLPRLLCCACSNHFWLCRRSSATAFVAVRRRQPKQKRWRSLAERPAHTAKSDALNKNFKPRGFKTRRLHDHLPHAGDWHGERSPGELSLPGGAGREQFASAENFKACLSSPKSSISAGAGMMASASASCASICTARSASSATAIRI